MSADPPDLDAPCGEHFTFRDLIACGETWHQLTETAGAPFDNLPRLPDTYAAMRRLCADVLDPVVRRFGRITLTYAFASRALTRHIPARIHPPADQHAGHELSAGGRPICPRLGLAADFAVAGVDARDLALWIIEHTPFDRLYLYEPDRPLHVSVGPEEARQIVHMARGPSGRRVPRVISAERLRAR